MNKFVLIGAIAILGVGLLVWLFIISTKPLPGVEELQNSRAHLEDNAPTDYKFNPPTSGDHYATWITKGFYNEPRADGNIVHSEEHGYVIFWYNCEKKLSDFGIVYGQSAPMSGDSEGTPSARLSDMPKAFSDGSCDGFKSQINDLLTKFGPHKLIAMPRVGMDSPLVLTAWSRSLRLNSLNESKIKEFINAFRDNGPEHTNEP